MATFVGLVSIETGSSNVSGSQTSFVAVEGDLFILRGLTAVIDRVVSSNQLLLKQPWAGPTISNADNWDISPTGSARADAIADVRGGVIEAWNTLKKIYDNTSNFLRIVTVNSNVTAATALPPAPSGSVVRAVGADNGESVTSTEAYGGLPYYLLRRARGLASAPGGVKAGDMLGFYGAGGYTSSATWADSTGRLSFNAGEDFTPTAQGTAFVVTLSKRGTMTQFNALAIDPDSYATFGVPARLPAGTQLDGNDLKTTLAGKASLDANGKLAASQTDYSKGGDYKVDLGPPTLPAILTIAQEVKALGVVPAARLGITGGTADQTVAWQNACAGALVEYSRPVALNAGQSHRVGQRLQFPTGSGIINPSDAEIVADFSDFNNTSVALDSRYGPNAVVLSSVKDATRVLMRGIKLTLTAASASVFRDKKVQGLYFIGCTDLVVEDVDISGLCIGVGINIQSCDNFRLTRPYIHDGMVHTASSEKTSSQLTGIGIDGDELTVGGVKIGSRGRIEYPRIINLRSSSLVPTSVGDQTDGINISGQYADVVVLHPYTDNVNEGVDCFGRITMIGGFFKNAGNYAVKLVHGAQKCRVLDFEAVNVGKAGLIIQSAVAGEVQGISDNFVRGIVRNLGTMSVPALTVNQATATAISASAYSADDAYEVLIIDKDTTSPLPSQPIINTNFPVANNYVEIGVSRSTYSISPIRVTTDGSGNTVLVRDLDGSVGARKPMLSGNNSVRRLDTRTNIIATAASAQSFGTSTAVVNYANKLADPLAEWSGSVFRPQYAGQYRISANIRFPGNAGDTIILSVRLNGVVKRSDVRAYAAGQLAAEVSCILIMSPQDELRKLPGDEVDIAVKISSAQSNTPGEPYTTVTITRAPD